MRRPSSLWILERPYRGVHQVRDRATGAVIGRLGYCGRSGYWAETPAGDRLERRYRWDVLDWLVCRAELARETAENTTSHVGPGAPASVARLD